MLSCVQFSLLLDDGKTRSKSFDVKFNKLPNACMVTKPQGRQCDLIITKPKATSIDTRGHAINLYNRFSIKSYRRELGSSRLLVKPHSQSNSSTK